MKFLRVEVEGMRHKEKTHNNIQRERQSNYSTTMMIAAKHATEAGAAAHMPASTAFFPIESALPALTTNMAASSLTNGGNSCLDEQIERLKRCEYLREGEVKALCLRAREILVDESNVQRVDAPVTVR